MKSRLTLLAGLLCLFLISCNQKVSLDLSRIDPGSYDGTWWNRTPIRFCQTNFTENYAAMDVDDYVQTMVDMSATDVLFNTGGLVASYQTKLPYLYKNPYMGERDFMGELIEKLHEKGMRYFARFDFSRIDEGIAAQKPEWLFETSSGENIVANGFVHTCLNRGYLQEYAFEIMKEVITNYPIDGIFFNMLGYSSSTYDGTQYGICQCVDCKNRFREMYGLRLPLNNQDQNIQAYMEFRRVTSNDLFIKITSFIKQQNPKLVIYNYNDVGTQWIASESGASMRPGVDNIYHATMNVKRTLGSYTDHTPVNLIMGFQAIGYRLIMSSPDLLRNWWIENLLHGAPVSFVVCGSFYHYEDRKFFPIIHELFAFHKAYEKLFTNVQAVNNVGLLLGSGEEYQGMIKLLSEEHIMYDVLNPERLEKDLTPRKLEDYEVLIIDNITNMSENFITRLDNYVQNGGKLLVTGASSTNDENGRPMNRIRLKSLGVEPEYENFPGTDATYLKVSESDKKAFAEDDFQHFTLMMMNARFLKCKVKEGAQGYFRFLSSVNLYGPSERVYYYDSDITDFPGAVSNTYGSGKTVFIPWMIGTDYNKKGNYSQRALFLGSLNNLLNVGKNIETDASSMIEMTHLANLNGAFEWVGMINHSGFMGNSVREFVPVNNTTVRLKPLKPVKEVRLVRSGIKADFKQTKDGWIECVVPQIDDFEMMLCLYK